MKRVVLAVLLLAVGSAVAASAQKVTYLLGDAPAFSITYPDGWEVRTPRSEGRNVISAYPTDGSLLWHGIWVMRDATTVENSLERVQAMERGLFRNVELTREPWTEQIGEVAVRCYQATGLYQEDVPVESFMAFFKLPDGQIGAVGYIGESVGIEAHHGDLEAMLSSLEVER